jgi:hypothetical protein
MYRVLEIYKTGETSDWWAEQVMVANEDYPLSALVCDPSEPEYIKIFNDRLGSARGRDGNRIARKAKNPIKTGIDMVRWGLSKVDHGPRIYIVRGSAIVQDKARLDAKKPTCLEEEIPSFVWARSRDGAPVKERPDPTCSDHAMDCLRYAAMFMWNRDMSMEIHIPEYPEGSLGDMLGHAEVHLEAYS